MSTDEIEQEKHDGSRRANRANVTLLLTIAGLAINALGSGVFWFALPEKMRRSAEIMSDHEARIRVVEKDSSTQAGTLGRIDERTRNIQDTLVEFRANLRESHKP